LHAAPWRVRWLPVLHWVADSGCWMIALPLTTFFRYDFAFGKLAGAHVGQSALLAALLQALFGWLSGLYRRRWRYGSDDEAVAVVATIAATGLALWVVTLTLPSHFGPRSVPPLAAVFTMAGALAVRSLWRVRREHRNRPLAASAVVVVGAGSGAEQIVRSMLTDPVSPYLPVAMVDDDPMKANLRIHGVRVVGAVDQLAAVAAARQADSVLMAIPSADSEFVRRVGDICNEANLRMLVLPTVEEVFGAPVVRDIRPVTAADLLGRDEAVIDRSAVDAYLRGRRVLVTGAGGSIGSELCRQLAKYGPSALIMLDRDETGLQQVQLTLDGRGLLDDPNLVLADIRDEARMCEVFHEHRPDVVFHAAALKHLPLLEGAPTEAWKTNVLGTLHVLHAAQAVGVSYFVNISTDKAANPVSVLGMSKRLTERLTAHAAATADGTYVSVRFGNVLGSRGSVLTTFRSQADAGGPITVTHPDATRFFMSIEEAVRLTKYAVAIGRSGEVLVLDMGTPVRIVDVAQRFADSQDPPLPIVFTGLRPGEKLHEDLFSDDERGERRVHPLISHVHVPPLSIDEIVLRVGDDGSMAAMTAAATFTDVAASEPR